jgi:hypothetical protein
MRKASGSPVAWVSPAVRSPLVFCATPLQGARSVPVASAPAASGGGTSAGGDSGSSATTPEAVGVELGEWLLAHGAEELLGGVKGARRPITYGES